MELYEETIRLAASLSAYYIEQSIPVQLVTNARVLGETISSIVRLDSGSGQNHLASINEILAFIDLRKDPDISGFELLKEELERMPGLQQGGREPAYILLSSDHRKSVVDAHTELCETGADVLWLIPALQMMEVKVPLTERIIEVKM
jgi:hypothetical protein